MRVLVTGASGFVGGSLAAALWAEGMEVWGTHLSRPSSVQSLHPLPMDLADSAGVRRAIDAARPDWVVHSAAWPDLARCERDPETARRINVTGTETLARGCRDLGCRLIYLSTDQVFGGERGGYRETDQPRPVNQYGRSKLEGEAAALAAAGPGAACVLRLGLVYALRPGEERTAVEQVLAMIRRGERPGLFTDEIRSPILIDDIAEAVRRMLGLARGQAPSLLHLGGPDAVSRHQLGLAMAERFAFDPALIDARVQADHPGPGPRPRDCSLDSTLACRTLGFAPRGIRDGLAALA